jgi:hypothetical protein
MGIMYCDSVGSISVISNYPWLAHYPITVGRRPIVDVTFLRKRTDPDQGHDPSERN